LLIRVVIALKLWLASTEPGLKKINLTTKRLKTLAILIISSALIGACARQPPSPEPKFTGRLLLLAGDHTNGADLFELTAAPAGSTYNYSIVTKGVSEASASPDGSHLLYATKDGILLRDLVSGKVNSLLKGESYCLAWAPDGKHFSYKQGAKGTRAKLYAADVDGKTKLIWEDLVPDQAIVGCPHWVAPDRLVFDRFLGMPQQKQGAEALKPNTTTMAIIGDSLRLIDTDRKWAIEGVCAVGGGAFLRSVDQNELLIAKNLNDLKTVNASKGPCSTCRFLGFAAQSCVPFFIEDSSSTSSEIFSLNPTNWQRQRSAHLGEPFSLAARALINSSARLMVIGDEYATLVLIDTESGDVTSFFAKSAGPPDGISKSAALAPVAWIEK
jgi:hypothetical protein